MVELDASTAETPHEGGDGARSACDATAGATTRGFSGPGFYVQPGAHVDTRVPIALAPGDVIAHSFDLQARGVRRSRPDSTAPDSAALRAGRSRPRRAAPGDAARLHAEHYLVHLRCGRCGGAPPPQQGPPPPRAAGACGPAPAEDCTFLHLLAPSCTGRRPQQGLTLRHWPPRCLRAIPGQEAPPRGGGEPPCSPAAHRPPPSRVRSTGCTSRAAGGAASSSGSSGARSRRSSADLARTSPAPRPHLARTSPAPRPHLACTSPEPLL